MSLSKSAAHPSDSRSSGAHGHASTPGTLEASNTASVDARERIETTNLHAPLPSKTSSIGQDALAALYPRIRSTMLALCAPLALEDYVVQSMSDASPVKWHLAHTSWFFETFVLGPHAPGYRAFDERYAALFNSYYIAAGERHPRPERGLLSRPTVAEVLLYRGHVDRHMDELLRTERLAAEARLVVELGLNHEEQHQELVLTDVKHMLAQNPIETAYAAASSSTAHTKSGESTPSGTGTTSKTTPDDTALSGSSTAPTWIPFAGGRASIGHAGPSFAYDNERARHDVWLAPFELATHPVTNGEWLRFVHDGGYERPELWLSDGWDRLQSERWHAPLYWRATASGWSCFTLAGTRALGEREPVCHVSYFEAEAYARWAGARLPSEAEWEIAAREIDVAGNLLETRRLHPAPGASRASSSIVQVFGDVWEWTASPYLPYPGFVPFAGLLGEYNGKFMSNRMVLRGGSCATPARHIRATYRNFFAPHARWQFAGLRLAR